MPCYSVPTSPAMARSTSNKSQPVTPQRPLVQRNQHRHSLSHSQPFRKSPITPVSPYTPLSLRSFTSGSGGSSTLTTPDQLGPSAKRLSFSPHVVKSPGVENSRDHSLADMTQNWRSRANENGIKVSSAHDDAHFGDDEASEMTVSDIANESGFISTEDALLAPSLIVDHRRSSFPTVARPRARSHAPLPNSTAFSSPTQTRRAIGGLKQPVSPLVPRSLNLSRNSDITSTPPPNRALARQLKMKGSFTDPAHTRRREAFAPLPTPAPNSRNKSFNLGLTQDTSLDLFDIDENDYENESDNNSNYNRHLISPDDPLMETSIRAETTIPGTPFEAHGYQGYPLPPFPSYTPQHHFPSHMQTTFLDPFPSNTLGSMTESVEHFFHTQQGRDDIQHMIEPGIYPHLQPWGHPHVLVTGRPSPVARDRYRCSPAWVPIPRSSSGSSLVQAPGSSEPVIAYVEPKKAPTHSGCSVCLAPSPPVLALLIPCSHPLCSGCLTSALNIVGEKDMECAVCRGKVLDFRLVSGNGKVAVPPGLNNSEDGSQGENQPTHWLGSKAAGNDFGKGFLDPFSPSSESDVGNEIAPLTELEKSFEFGLDLENARASTPKHGERRDMGAELPGAHLEGVADTNIRAQQQRKKAGTENIVLRIDNVPWDITPPQIEQWLQQPLEHVHVLLDKRGKTMSHAYIEVADLDISGKILRGEVRNKRPGGKSCERGSVLGKGRRARGVTITRCGQEELMADLFPIWKGSFDGSRPSLAGLSNEQVISALGSGLLAESEVVGLLHLIKEPDSHFLKAPSLPYHSLISILKKFPTDVDSRVFWSAGVRDMLYDVTYGQEPTLLCPSCSNKKKSLAAVQILLSRFEGEVKPPHDKECSVELACKLARAASSCAAFTNQQLSKFTEILESCALPVQPLILDASLQSASQPKTTETREPCARALDVHQLSPSPVIESEDNEALTKLAKEFGVEAQLVQALVQRLAGLY